MALLRYNTNNSSLYRQIKKINIEFLSLFSLKNELDIFTKQAHKTTKMHIQFDIESKEFQIPIKYKVN